MASIHKEFLVAASPDHVWAAVRDFGAVHQRLTPGLTVATGLEADVRTVTFANGLVLREVLVSLDETSRRLVYASVQGRATHHNASMQVLPEGDKRSRIVWITDVLPNELEQYVRELVEQGSAIMKRTLEGVTAGR
ncbi:MAG: SRPBCC family protein [Rhodoferax sp.]|nr:SRPBCC family protein [Rhodoferax sp.]